MISQSTQPNMTNIELDERSFRRPHMPRARPRAGTPHTPTRGAAMAAGSSLWMAASCVVLFVLALSVIRVVVWEVRDPQLARRASLRTNARHAQLHAPTTVSPPPRFLVYMTGQLRSFEFVAPLNEEHLATFQGEGGTDSDYHVFMLAEESFTSAGHGVTQAQVDLLPETIVSDTLQDPTKNPFLRRGRGTSKLNAPDTPLQRKISHWDVQYEQWRRCHAFAVSTLRERGIELPPHTPVIKTRFDAEMVELP